jgi:Bifunctional DNA primase/polymerase, N-terminal
VTAQATRGPALHVGATALAAHGWHVFPCLRGGKRPAVKDDWEQRASADLGLVRRYWPSARHNIGVACGPSGLVVLDLDTHGTILEDWRMPGIRDGKDVLALICEWAGQPWPATHTVTTPSGGWHLYYRAPGDAEIRNSQSLIGPMVDVRARGGYVLGECSIIGGKAYEALDDDAPAPLPPWITRLLTRRPDPVRPAGALRGTAEGRLRALITKVSGGQPGNRNGVLYWASCRAAELITAGEVSRDDAEEYLVAAALEAGLRGGEREARRTFASAMRGDAR